MTPPSLRSNIRLPLEASMLVEQHNIIDTANADVAKTGVQREH
eukprot:CAMPEP_0172542022 /NCGR_PEP_ID=MMETSP1067-20121228/12716_1 /TAXON_ID=265564 ORGANISM="Thalassiosira punctigera, Strain Tpunct2005C2" /NCGR_SAMPLE_ID=MMETSP1067 /ASSEMBLY_ACC=CAM_ASM_000444 /LENGTH=42 /DNA_ID= /DNA_START= /DNA_END= /DNA_ORIENTATION=